MAIRNYYMLVFKTRPTVYLFCYSKNELRESNRKINRMCHKQQLIQGFRNIQLIIFIKHKGEYSARAEAFMQIVTE